MIPKFRCFDKDTKTMQDVLAIDFSTGTVEITQYNVVWFMQENKRSISEVILMQSTGMYDSTKFEELSEEEQEEWLESGKSADEWQGREIFEGDIVNKNTTFRNPMTGSGTLTLNKNFEVVFINGMFTRDGSSMGLSKDLKYLTVIGNVHQHPELLEDV